MKIHDRAGIRLQGKRKQWELLITQPNSLRVLRLRINSRRVLNADKHTWLAGRAGTQQVSCHFKQQRTKIKHIAGGHYSVLRQPNNEQ